MSIAIGPCILATKIHKGAQRKKDNRNHLNKKFLGVRDCRNLFSKKVALKKIYLSIAIFFDFF